MLHSPANNYFAVNDRPVVLAPAPDGGMDVLVFDWESGAFARDMSYLSRCFEPGKDVDHFSKERFYAYVKELRARIPGAKEISDEEIHRPRESWNFDTFVQCYNAIAIERGGVCYRGSSTPEDIGDAYEKTLSETICEFALGEFQLDQEY